MDLLDKMASYVLALKKIAGLHIHLLPDDQVRIHYVILEKKKNLISVLNSWEFTSLQELIERVDLGIPISLSLDGKGILTKRLSSGTGDSPVRQVLPHADDHAFYYSLLQEGSWAMISLGRKDLVEQYIEKLRQANFSIAQVSLGSLSINAIVPFLASPDMEIQLLHQRVLICDGLIQEVKPGSANETITLGEEQLNSKILQPYANAVQQLLRQPMREVSSFALIHQEWLHQVLFKKLIISGLSFYFLILFINFFVFQDVSNTNVRLTNQLNQHKYHLAQQIELEEKVNKQEKLQSLLGLGRQSLFSYYADRLSASLYKEILLTDLLIHPMEVEKGKQMFVFKVDWMEVKGVCDRPVVLNKWIEALEQQEWVEEIVEQKYTTSWQREEGTFSFLLKTKRQ
jgi:hypothetical protein